MTKISIKTVDGSRFDYLDKDGTFDNLGRELETNSFIVFPVDGGRKFINIDRIVSITETEVESNG